MIRTLTAATLALLTVVATAVSADAPATAVSSPAGHASPSAAAQPKTFFYVPKESDVTVGKEEAPVTIVEYASLSCPHCAHFYTQVLPALSEKYIDTGKVKLVYRNYPLNDPALKGAELMECVAPERRHAFLKVMFSTQMKWATDVSYREALSNIAVLGGMPRLKFESCMNDKAVERTVLNVAKEASEDYKVNSTPTFYVNGSVYKGDHDLASLSKVIDDALAKTHK